MYGIRWVPFHVLNIIKCSRGQVVAVRIGRHRLWIRSRQLRAAYRANTRGTIMEKDGTTSNELTPLQQKWSDEHWLLQYDLMFGKGYALGRMGLEGLAEDAE